MKTFLAALISLLPLLNLNAGESKEKKSWSIIGEIACSSLNKLNQEAKKVNIPLPPFLTSKFIEKQFGFIGQGNVDGDKPISIVFVGGKEVTKDKMAFFVIPLKDNGPALQIAQRGKLYKNSKDTYILNGKAVFRATKDYFIMGAHPESILNYNTNNLKNIFKKPSLLFNAKTNLQNIRRISPQLITMALKGLFDKSDKSNPANSQDKAYELGKDTGEKIVTNFINRLESTNLSLEINQEGDFQVYLDINLFNLKLTNSKKISTKNETSNASFNNMLFDKKLFNDLLEDDGAIDKRIGYTKEEIKMETRLYTHLINFLWLGQSTNVSYKIIDNELAVLVSKKINHKNELDTYLKKLKKMTSAIGITYESLELIKLEKRNGFTKFHFIDDNFTGFYADYFVKDETAYCVFSQLGVKDPKKLFSKTVFSNDNIANLVINSLQILKDFRQISDNDIFNADKESYQNYLNLLKTSKPLSLIFSAENKRLNISINADKNIVSLISNQVELKELSKSEVYDKTIISLNQRIGKRPTSYQLYFERADTLISQNKIDKAILDLTKAQSINPKTSKILARLMDTHLLISNFKEALNYSKIMNKELKHLSLTPYFMNYQVGVIKEDQSILKKAKNEITAVIKKRTHKNINVKLLEYLSDKLDQTTLLELAKEESKDDKKILIKIYYFIALKEMENKNNKNAIFYFNKCINKNDDKFMMLPLLSKAFLKKIQLQK